MRTEEALASMESARSFEQLSAMFQRRVEGAGFAAFEYVDISNPEAMAPLGGGTARRWREVYASQRFDRVDPYLARARRVDLPFDWASAGTPAKADPALARLMQAAHDFGLREGFVCPHHWRDASGRRHDEVCALFWTGGVSEFRAVMESQRNDLHLQTLYFMQRAARLRERKPLDESETPKLTARERDVLSWAARGKTSAETATILGVSPLTAETHVRNATAKLDATSKTHAVAIAIAYGLLHP